MAAKQAPVWFGVLFALVGTWIILVALDLVPNDPAALQAPRWVLGLCGLAFFGAGVLVWLSRYGAPWMSDATAFVIIASMAAIGSWIALGPGEREFDGSIGLGPFAFRGDGVSLGRIFFGIGAVVTWVVALVPLWRILASALRPNIDRQPIVFRQESDSSREPSVKRQQRVLG
jgi:hypothetical protein